MSEEVILVTNKVCPFAHRAWLTLLEKNVDFKLREVDLYQKEPWFTQTYQKAYAHDPKSNGKVPILIHGERIITESDLISWYVAESFPSGSELIPKDPFQRLKLRKFVQEVPDKIISAFYLTAKFNSKNQEEQGQIINKITQGLRVVENQIQGPFAIGDTFTLADIFIYPWFERWVVNQRLFGIKLPEQFTKIRAFINAVQARPSVQKAKSEVSQEFFVKAYEKFLKG